MRTPCMLLLRWCEHKEHRNATDVTRSEANLFRRNIIKYIPNFWILKKKPKTRAHLKRNTETIYSILLHRASEIHSHLSQVPTTAPRAAQWLRGETPSSLGLAGCVLSIRCASVFTVCPTHASCKAHRVGEDPRQNAQHHTSFRNSFHWKIHSTLTSTIFTFLLKCKQFNFQVAPQDHRKHQVNYLLGVKLYPNWTDSTT